ncbi:glycerophosphodiester phosphodiesterase family protein [Winogradskyella alexanderae]|uniref:Glycerophosphodiester phosphodiesterase n=1 Tax=Winogradskyella alexanderae TaxID=2877123 RepID=A0ABS7XS35_9FLAO|nr:glycerophosphodiester phosphodiesterase family protein [Winogradskyella alexanderae]MCA0132845.1 glycerophosphodiester phosphodiesterase [Winogradskyella alexanderae]
MGCANSKLDVQGHRGCRGLYPENTLPAFKKAIELGVTTLELDIVISKDNKVVVSHEPYINSVICYDVNGNTISEDEALQYNFYKLNYEAIKHFDCGSKFHPVYPNQKKLKTYKPLLKDLFDLVESLGANVRFNIEIKSDEEYYGKFTPFPREYVSVVLKEINDSGFTNRSNLQSFDINVLEEINKQDPKMPVALLVEEDEEILKKLQSLSFKPKIISPFYKLLSKDLISTLHAENHLVIPWTINEVKDMTHLIDMGVDGIITDYPDRLIDLLENRSY